MVYSVKEMYLTIQGEGGQTGLPAVFLRFAGCNLWSGLERDRKSAICQFCDTDFIGTDGSGGGKFKAADDLVSAISAHWPDDGKALKPAQKWIVATGGEPLLQLDDTLIDALHRAGFKIAVESNGTVIAPEGIDWLCISPKAGTEIVQTSGQELKLVYPQAENGPDDFAHMDFSRFSLQPRDDTALLGAAKRAAQKNANHVKACVDYCLANPQWRLSIQTHKMIGID